MAVSEDNEIKAPILHQGEIRGGGVADLLRVQPGINQDPERTDFQVQAGRADSNIAIQIDELHRYSGNLEKFPNWCKTASRRG